MDFSVHCVNKIWLDWKQNKTEQFDNEKSHQKKLMNPPILSEVSSDKTHNKIVFQNLEISGLTMFIMLL